MAKWKYAKEKKVPMERPYIYLPNEKYVEMTLKDWTFEKNAYNESLFSTHVITLDGEEVEKIWSVWDFELKEALKKILKGKNVNKHAVKIKIIKHQLDEVDSEYEVSEIKE